MGKNLAVLFAVTFGVVILGISIIQVRGLSPGDEKPDIAFINPNSELSLYLSDPGYFLTVLQQRGKALMLFEPAAKTDFLIYLAQQRFDTAEELLESKQTGLGLWLLRKAIVYQSRAIALLPQVETSRTQFTERLNNQSIVFATLVQEQASVLQGNELAKLNLLDSLLTDNTQAIKAYLPAGE